jgi:hypothetical protein
MERSAISRYSSSILPTLGHRPMTRYETRRRAVLVGVWIAGAGVNRSTVSEAARSDA